MACKVSGWFLREVQNLQVKEFCNVKLLLQV